MHGKLLTSALIALGLFTCSVAAEEIDLTDTSNDIEITSESELGDKEESNVISLVDTMDKKTRLHKETMIRERVIMELSGVDTEHSIDITGNETVNEDIDPELYYTCYDGITDYVLTEYNGELYVFYVRITVDGQYFLSRVKLSGQADDKFRAMMTSENQHTDTMFWNKVALSKPDDDQEVTIRPVDANGVMLVPYFNQGAGYYVGNGEWTATDWPNVQFNVNGHTMHEAGCGFFSTAMALSYLKQRIIAPPEFKENGQYIANEGSAVTVGVATAETYGVHAYFTSDINEVIEALRNGHPVMEHVGKSIFTNEGHYILLVGYTKDGMFAVNDPGHKDNTYFYNGITFDQSTILNAAKDISTAFTIFE